VAECGGFCAEQMAMQALQRTRPFIVMLALSTRNSDPHTRQTILTRPGTSFLSRTMDNAPRTDTYGLVRNTFPAISGLTVTTRPGVRTSAT
jgi:hypothetical protein